MLQNYARQQRDGRYPATMEIIYGHAWKAAPRKTEDGRAIIRFSPKKGG
jgi:malonyl-CoA O-methyltransferase